MPSAADVSSMNMKRPVRSSSSNELQALLLGCAKDDGKEMMGRHHQEGVRGGGRAAFDEIWSSIIAASNKLEKQAVDHKDGSSSDPHAAAAYIHPSVKTSSSTLSEKSLDICTESLGSETGSDGFSSYPASPPQRTDKGDLSDDQDQRQHQPFNVVVVEETIMKEEEAVSQFPKYNCCSRNNSSSSSGNAILLSGSSGGGSRKRSSAVPPVAARRSFPPPLPSLALCEGGSNLIHLRSHRQNGRLLLEAVSVPISQKCFRAQRQDGRLLLTLATTNTENNEQAILEEEEEEIIDELGLAGNEPTNSESESEEEEEGGEEERIFDKDVENRYGHGLALIMGEEDEKDTVLIIGKWPRGFVTINMQIDNFSFGWPNHQYPHNRPSSRINSDYSYHYFGSASTRRPFLTQGFTSTGTGSGTASERSKSLRITTKS